MDARDIRAALRMLKRVRSDLSRDARDRARGRVDKLIARLEYELSEGGSKRLSARELLEELAKLIPTLGKIAELVHAIRKGL